MKHLSMTHSSTKLVAKNTIADTVDDDSRPGVANVSSANKEPGALTSLIRWGRPGRDFTSSGS